MKQLHTLVYSALTAWEKFSRIMRIPASTTALRGSYCSDVGPMVATILVSCNAFFPPLLGSLGAVGSGKLNVVLITGLSPLLPPAAEFAAKVVVSGRLCQVWISLKPDADRETEPEVRSLALPDAIEAVRLRLNILFKLQIQKWGREI